MPGSPLSAHREMRFRWYVQVEKHGKTVKEVCSIFGITTKTYHKWYNRDHGYGPNNYRNPRQHPNTKLTSNLKVAIYDAKTKYNYGPKKMQLYIKDHCGVLLSATIIYRYYKKRRLIRNPQKKQPWYTPMKQPFVASKPGQNVQCDVKFVPSKEGGWDYQFRFIDTFTNMQYTIDCFDKSAQSTIYAFKLAQKYLPFQIMGIQTDNGGEFRGRFAEYLNSLGVTHRFIPKRSAPWNGKVERANRSVDDEYYMNMGRPWGTIAQYTHWYNHERYHLGRWMNGLTPAQKLQQYLSTTNQKVSPLNVN